jgi:hypothetical protein
MVSHATILKGAVLAGGGRGERLPPTILRLDRADFVPHLLIELQSTEGRARLEAAVQQRPEPLVPVKLEQLVHRAFNLVLAEALCLVPDEPRVDPARIESAGLVVRREGAAGLEAWLKRDGLPLGWQPLPGGAGDADSTWDPDPARRRARRLGANGRLLRRLDSMPGEADVLAEDTSPLFTAPPQVAKATGRTLLYGYLPVSSNERQEDAPAPPPFGAADIADRVPALLRSDRAAADVPPTGRGVSVSQAQVRPETLPDSGGVRALVDALNYLAQEAGAFTGETYAAPLATVLRGVSLSGAAKTNLFDLLALAYAVLVERRPELDVTAVAMPDAWPRLSQAGFEQLVEAVHAAMVARWQRLAPAAARFDQAEARYQVRCFIRVDRGDGCPPCIVWSPPSPAFTIKPWYESGDAPPIQIELPALTPERMRDLKPNVAFKVPPEIQQFIDKLNLQGPLDGEANKKAGIKFGMICGFSIPLITICACIVLQIFLVLLHIVFFWLPFIRICIPFRVLTSESEEGS